MTTAIMRLLGPDGPEAARPDLRRDWKPLLAACLLAYLGCLLLRLIDLPAWDHPGLFVDGGRIMGTHDAYFWLAAAEGVRPTFNSEMHTLLSWLSALFGGDLVDAAFYGPALLSGLTGVVGALWGWLLAGRNGAWLAGLLAGVAPGFFRRTRLGYYDTDLMTLLMPLLTAFLLAFLLRGLLRGSWLADSPEEADPGWLPFVLVLPIGLVARSGWFFHQDVFSFGLVLLCLSLVLVLVAGKPGRRGEALLLLAIFSILAFWNHEGTGLSRRIGLASLLAAPALVGAWLLAPAALRAKGRNIWVGAGVFAAVVLVGGFPGWLLQNVWSQLAPYFKPVADSAGAAAAAGVTPPSYPAIAQSIIEAKNVDLGNLLMRLGPFTWLAPFGIIGFLWVLVRRPVALLLLPLLGLGLMAWKLGVRFTMFGGPAVAVGLGVPLAWGLERWGGPLRRRPRLQPAAHLAIGLAVLVGLGFVYKNLSLTPVIDKPHGEALVELGRLSPEKATVWTWWDYGYVTQFYAGHMTPSDGGQHAGRHIYPTAVALVSDSLAQSANMIRFAATHGGDPAAEWDRMGASAAAGQVRSLRGAALPAPQEPQYLVVPWALMRISKWLTFFGNWDLETGGQGSYRFQRVTQPFRIDPQRGALLYADGSAPVPLASVDLLDGSERKHHEFPHFGAPHLVINDVQKDIYLLDDDLYGTAMVQLLVRDPQDPEVREHFELVVEGAPHVRVFRVR